MFVTRIHQIDKHKYQPFRRQPSILISNYELISCDLVIFKFYSLISHLNLMIFV